MLRGKLRSIALATGLALATAPLIAQQRILAVIDAPDGSTNLLWEARVDDGRVSSANLRAATRDRGTRPAVTAGGRFAIWHTYGFGSDLAVLDRISGTTLIIPGLDVGVIDPRRVRMFISRNGAISSLTPEGTSALPGTGGLLARAVAADGSRLYATRPAGGQYELIAVDPDTGTALGPAVPIGTSPSNVVAAPDGNAVWLVSASTAAPDQPLLRRFDWPSGDERVTVPIGFPGDGRTHSVVGVDSVRRRVVTLSEVGLRRFTPPSASVQIRDSDTGATVGGPFGMIGLGGIIRPVVDLGTGEVLCLSQVFDLNPRDAWLLRHSVETGVEISRQPLGTTGYLGNAAFAVPPRSPVLHAATVTLARTVTLSWTPAPELAVGYTLEAGSGPGLSNLAVGTTSDSTLVVPNVPPGSYYVRVKALNYIGASVPSNEIVVHVP
jgi:hypothetical protein